LRKRNDDRITFKFFTYALPYSSYFDNWLDIGILCFFRGIPDPYFAGGSNYCDLAAADQGRQASLIFDE
jgi:hypothetical protein